MKPLLIAGLLAHVPLVHASPPTPACVRSFDEAKEELKALKKEFSQAQKEYQEKLQELTSKGTPEELADFKAEWQSLIHI